MADAPADTFREKLGHGLNERARRCLGQAWAERSGNTDAGSVKSVIDQITAELGWSEDGQISEIVLRALEIATSWGRKGDDDSPD